MIYKYLVYAYCMSTQTHSELLTNIDDRYKPVGSIL